MLIDNEPLRCAECCNGSFTSSLIVELGHFTRSLKLVANYYSTGEKGMGKFADSTELIWEGRDEWEETKLNYFNYSGYPQVINAVHEIKIFSSVLVSFWKLFNTIWVINWEGNYTSLTLRIPSMSNQFIFSDWIQLPLVQLCHNLRPTRPSEEEVTNWSDRFVFGHVGHFKSSTSTRSSFLSSFDWLDCWSRSF